MRYFFLIYALLLMLVILVLPTRFGKFSETEWRIFPDMDEQDKLLGQRASSFFADGRGARTPDKNLVPMGFAPINEETRAELPEFGFTNGTGYVFSGKKGEEFVDGIPLKKLGVKDIQDVRQLLAHGEERYNINCSACHGVSANGDGVVKSRAAAFGGIPNLMTTAAKDGYIFEVITNGRNMMGSFKHNTSIRDRWAIIAYLRSLQDAKKEADKK